MLRNNFLPKSCSKYQTFVRKNYYATCLMKFFSARLFVIALFVLAGFISLGVARAYYQEYQLQAEIDRLEEEIRGVEQKRLASLDLLAYVLSPAFVEEKARLELNMKRPGERVVVVAGAQSASGGAGEGRAEIRQEIPNPLKWWYYFTRHGMPQP